MKRIMMWTAVFGLMGLAAYGELKNPVFDTDEAGLLAVLRSDAPQDDKVAACQTLCFKGTAASVAPLAALLKEETPMPLFHAARYGLENIPDAQVEAALLAAAGQVKGLRLAGVMQSLGNRKAAAAVPTLAPGLTGADPAITRAAAGALAKIRNAEALAALRKAAPTVPAAAVALLEAADRDVETCRFLSGCGTVAPTVRLAALRGLILASSADEAAARWLETIRSNDPDTVGLALRLVAELPVSEQLTKAVADALQTVPAARARLITAVADRPQLPLAETLLKLADGGDGIDAETRFAAAYALARNRNAKVLPVFVRLALYNGPQAARAKGVLTGFPGAEGDAVALGLLKRPGNADRRLGAELVGLRRMRGSLAEIVALADDPDEQVRASVLKALGELAGTKDLDLLLGLLAKHPESAELSRALSMLFSREMVSAAGSIAILQAQYGLFETGQLKDVTPELKALVAKGERAVTGNNSLAGMDPAPGKVKQIRIRYTVDGTERTVQAREGSSAWLSGQLLPKALEERLAKAFDASSGANRRALLRVIANMDTAYAFNTLKAVAAQADADPALREDAIRALAGWKSQDALPELAKYARQAPSDRLRVLALRGYLRLLDEAFLMPAEKKAALYGEAATWAVRDEDRKAALAAQNQLSAQAELAKNDGFVPIFNGKNLDGWEQQDVFFTVQNGILTGETTEEHPCRPNHHLIWKKEEVKNFELIAEFRLSEKANSGIQIRCNGQTIGDNGYQADMDGAGNYPGFIYHPRQHLVGERGADVILAADGKKTVNRFADGAELGKLYKKGDWNTYRILCVDRKITIWLNGTKPAHVEDARLEMLPETGYIAIQLHQGPPMKVEYRSVRYKKL